MDENQMPQLVKTLALSYHRIALEEEYFSNYEEAFIHFENAL